MGHHAEDIALCIDDSRDVAHRAIRIVWFVPLNAGKGGVPEDDLSFALDGQPAHGQKTTISVVRKSD